MDAIGTAEAPGHSSNSAYRNTAEMDRIQMSPVAVEIAAPETQASRGAGIVPSRPALGHEPLKFHRRHGSHGRDLFRAAPL